LAALIFVVLIALGLAWKAGLYGSRARVVDSETEQDVDCGLFDVCARTLVLVFLCLLGLVALGMMYGNVLGAAAAP
jgi:hypothetical protein